MKTIVMIIASIVLLSTAIINNAESIEFTVAKIQWIKSEPYSDYTSIQVIEPDMNLYSDKIEKFKIHIWSDSDKKGITPEVYETEENSGVFVSNIYFSSNHSTGQRIFTVEEDLVFGLYEDHTIPTSYDVKTLDVLDSMIVRKTLGNPDNVFIRIDDPTFVRQDLQKGETLGDVQNTFGWFVLAMSSFIVFAYITMRIKRRKRK